MHAQHTQHTQHAHPPDPRAPAPPPATAPPAARRSGLSRRTALHRAAAGAAAPALLAAACALRRTPATDAPPPTRAPVTLSYLTPTGLERQQMERALFDDLTRALPHITINIIDAANWDEVKNKLLIGHVGGVPVAMTQAGWSTWLDLWSEGVVVELSALFRRDGIDPAKTFIDSALFQWQHEGKIGGLPISTSADALAYNVELFNAAGLRPPPVDPTAAWWNMDTFLDYARRLTNVEKLQFGFGGTLAGANTGGFTTGTYFGQGAWDDAQKQCRMDTPAFQRGLQFWKDLGPVHHVQPVGQEAAQMRGGQSINVFFTGKVGMQVLLITQAALPFTWSVATLPYGGPPGSPNVSGRIHNHALLMGQTSAAERDATWQVFRWLLQPANAGRFPRTAGHVVSPLRDPAASEESQRRYREQLGVDPRAYLLQAQTTRPSGWGMTKYANFSKVGPALDERYTKEYLADTLGTKEYAEWATRYVNENLGAR